MTRWPALLVLSLSLHLLLVWLVRAPVSPREQAPQNIEVSFELIDPAPTAAEPSPASIVASTTLTPKAEATTRAIDTRAPREETVVAVSVTMPIAEAGAVAATVTDVNAATSTEGVAVDDAARAPSQTTAPRISARDAARALIPIGSVASANDVAQDDLNAALACAANTKPHLQRRGPPELLRGSDGSYVHEAPGFFATIHRDGHVTFRGKPRAQLHPSTTFLTGNIDVTDAMLSAMGEELYPAEKRWFLEQTEALRAQLEADDRLQWFARARLDLLRRLQTIVDSPRLTISQKRDEVFAVWLDCADDEVGARGRALVEGFVRDHFAESSARAFSSSDLLRLNQRNASQRAFRPYDKAAASTAASQATTNAP